MRRKEREVIKALLSLQREEIEITASGVVLISDINLSPYQVAKILRKFAEEVFRDPHFNHNIYRINLNSLLEEIADEESAVISESE